MRSAILPILIALATSHMAACQQPASQRLLPPDEFQVAYTSDGKAQLVDVRTADEFSRGHLPGAVNIDWNSPSFRDAAARTLDRERPVYVYCLVGGRSASAAKALAAMGFHSVTDMKGGFMAYEQGGRPVARTAPEHKGMGMADLAPLLVSDLPVVVDFYAPWCGPCKRMMPMWDDLQSTHSQSFKVLTIDSDMNRQLSREVGVREIPTILIYRGGKEVWRHVGFISKDDLLAAVAGH